MTDALLSLLVVVVAVALAAVVWLIRNDRMPHAAVLAATAVCVVGLLAMILTDWPLVNLAQFWADHSVLAGTLSSLLLVGIVFLVYERGEKKRQEELAEGLSGAGAGGIVDHIVDAEVALALLSSPTDPATREPQFWADWATPGKPLRWLRAGRGVILNSPTDPARDPRSVKGTADDPLQPWGRELIDQSIRRLLAAMRDWSSLIGSSGDGTEALLLLSRVRTDLMELYDLYPDDYQAGSLQDRQRAYELAEQLRIRLRILAAAFEEWSGANTFRREVLPDAAPLPPVLPDFGRTGATLSRRLADTAAALGFGQPRTTVEDAREFVQIAHGGQVDKLGRDYYTSHLLPIAAKLEPHGDDATMAGLLHDVLEDTSVTADQLRQLGIPKSVVRAVQSVTKRDGEPYDELIRRSAADPLGRIVKLADNEHNRESNADLAAVDPTAAARLMKKYDAAREVLLAAGR